MLKGKNIELKPMPVSEIRFFFEQAIQSPFWYGEPYGDPVPTYEKFKEDWKDYYFDGSEPEKGRAFSILVDDRMIGEVSYNQINREDDSVELDIIIFKDEDKGKGHGPDALKTLINYLVDQMGIKTVWIDVVKANKRAIRAYEKTGFKERKTFTEDGVEVIRYEYMRS